MSIEARFRIGRAGFTLDVDLRMPVTGVTAVFGPSGCGKTTLLRAIAGLDRHAHGFLKIGDDTWQAADHFTPPHRRPLGYVFQEPSLFGHLSVRRNVEYGLKRVPASSRTIPVEDAIELLGIGPLLTRNPDTLSGGERQRVAIARALAVSPRLLLMDEPLAALDRTSREEIFPYLESLSRELEIPIIHVSHAADEVARLADHLVLLAGGRVEATGPIGDLLTRLDLSPAHAADAEAMIEAVVGGHDEDYQLTRLDFGGGHLFVPHRDLPVGRQVRVRLAARDVSLTLERQNGTSILNILPVTVDDMAEEGGAQVIVRLMAGTVPLLSRVTRKSAVELGLQRGSTVFAQVKSVVLLA